MAKVFYVKSNELDGFEFDKFYSNYDKIYVDFYSGKRRGLIECMKSLKSGDEICIKSIYNVFGFNIDACLEFIFEMTSRNIFVTCIKENLTFTGDDTIKQTTQLCTLESMSKSIKENRGRKRILNESQIERIITRWMDGVSMRQLAITYKVNKQTISNYIKKYASKI